MAMSTKEMQATVADLGDARRPDQARPPVAESRNAGIDALRASLTLLVVFHHAAVTYGGRVRGSTSRSSRAARPPRSF
jgi:hypothetical protein